MNALCQAAFWIAALLLAYVYVGYGLVLTLVARCLPQRRVCRSETYTPCVTLVISAYNERAVIAEKIRNSVAIDYPMDRLEVIVVSDASDDGTDEIVRAHESGRVRLLAMPRRSGKTAGLNAAVAQSRADVVVFSDANSMYESSAVRKLVRNLADASVGAVTGEQRYEVATGDQAGESENLYWRYEQMIKRMETGLGSVVGGDGAIYAIRRELYEPLRAEDLSDFVNPLQIVSKGWRNVYEPEAVATEAPSPDLDREYGRKVRIVNRAWRGLLRVPSVLNPWRVGLFSWQVVSHKLLRWLVPVLLLIVFATSAALAADRRIYAVALVAQVAFYALAALGWMFRRSSRTSSFVSVPYYFCLVNVASLHGIIDAARGRTYTKWSTGRT